MTTPRRPRDPGERPRRPAAAQQRPEGARAPQRPAAKPRPGERPRRPAAAGGARPPARPGAQRPGAKRPPVRPQPRPLKLADPKRRLRSVFIVLAVVFSVFAGRLVQIQLFDSDALAADAGAYRYVDVPLRAERGSITSSDGVALASTVDAYDINADPTMFTADALHITDGPEQAAALLAPILNVPKDKLAAKLRTPKSRNVALALRQTPQTRNQVMDLRTALTKKTDTKVCRAEKALLAKPADQGGRTTVDDDCVNPLGGIVPAPTAARVYPADGLASNLVGFVNGAGVGAGGLELQYQKQLAGQDGHRTSAVSNGQPIPTGGGSQVDAVPGSDIRLTINRDIQWEAQRAITDQVTTAGAEKGYVIVQDVKTGQILAMATSPGFNPNDLNSAKPDQLGNPALQDAYEPGSTAKLMTMAAVLDTGAATWDTHVTVPGTLTRADQVFHDDVDHDTWYLTLNGVLAKSSNIGTIEAAGNLGKTQQQANQVLGGYLQKFGIGQPSGLGFPGETRGILADPASWHGTQQFTIPFGQGLSVNALQATSVYSTIANGGVRVAPSLIEGTTGPDGRYTPAPAGAETRVVSEQTAKTLGQMLESVVSDDQGTGNTAQIPGYRVAGKTGTANRVDPTTGKYSGYTASFIGFAPADKPEITVSCVIQNPVNGHFGGPLCGPVFKQVMEFALKTLQVPPSGSQAPNLPVDWKP
ncbi:cell division protein FtsI (penicillin-binding protein 3) [Kitasatospora sp. MAP12-15]|uniref:peptidoglycan D,D-transpeptidase FtsI family protein n=1 Tax=unclassified Kitasatospora TaxID=2633591 RepID=UPI0024732566|nr:penicillin-binding protein 2 [Kitasatospora sp. MAP12-44]MDH6110009.1 cell division protein FtsI (penicillin-binding protein 3) [Kitasatospora sp. MAP12-44]